MRIGVRAPNWVGDCVLATAAVLRLRERLPGAELEVWVRPRLAPLFGAVASRVGARVRTLPAGRGLGAVWETARGMRASRLDAALLLAPSMRAGLEAMLAGIPVRLGYPDDSRAWLLTHPLRRELLVGHGGGPPLLQLRGRHSPVLQQRRGRYSPGSRAAPPFGRHILEEGLELADHLANVLGASSGALVRPQPFIEPPDEAQREATAVLARVHPRVARPLVGINPLSRGGETRNWPMEGFARLIGMLRAHIDPDLVIFGGPDEGRAIDALVDAAGRPDRLTALAGESALPLLTFAALAPQLTVLVTNDTGPMHLAAAAGAHLVVIFGSTLPALTGPAGEGHRCLHLEGLTCAGCYRKRCPYELQCLNGISAEEVLEAVLGQIPGSSGAPMPAGCR